MEKKMFTSSGLQSATLCRAAELTHLALSPGTYPTVPPASATTIPATQGSTEAREEIQTRASLPDCVS